MNERPHGQINVASISPPSSGSGDSGSTSRERPREQHGARVGLVLSGGGARGAYQAGVMRAVAEIADSAGLKRPLPILTGVSAGAVNAAYLATASLHFSEAAEMMAQMWAQMTADKVFRTDALTAGWLGGKFLIDATVGAFYKKKMSRSLLDTAPLRDFLSKHIQFDKLNAHVGHGHFDALAITAMNYTSSTSTTFVHGSTKEMMWTRQRRNSQLTDISLDHVIASSAIPLFFPPAKVGDDYFGDGCLRNTAPLSPAIHLGADRLLVVSVRKPDVQGEIRATVEPSIARVLGVMLNALLLDSVDLDMERMARINQTISLVPEDQKTGLSLRKVDYLWIRPSQDIGALAGDLFDHLPKVIRYLVNGLGSSREASELTSYLLFDPEFCGRLVEMGYQDGLSSAIDIKNFLTAP